MPAEVDRHEVQRLLSEEQAQLVEVLPEDEYREEHLPGAIHLPLTELSAKTAARLDPDRPVIVYCYDYACDQSPRAAWRLESLGFQRVYDYVNGKADWQAAGLPVEGELAGIARVLDFVQRDVPTCGLHDAVDQIRARLEGSDWDSCFVVNNEGVVLGRVYESKLGDARGATAESVMDPGPVTYRPNTTAHEMLETMREHDLETGPVTGSDGRLIGVVLRNDLERAVAAHEHAHQEARVETPVTRS